MVPEAILDRLVSFETVSHRSNRELIGFAASLLKEAGIEPLLIESADGAKANLYATTGPGGPWRCPAFRPYRRRACGGPALDRASLSIDLPGWPVLRSGNRRHERLCCMRTGCDAEGPRADPFAHRCTWRSRMMRKSAVSACIH